MKLKHVLYVIIASLGLLVVWLFISAKERAKKANRIIKRLRKDHLEVRNAYLKLFEKYLEAQQNVDIGLISEVQKLQKQISKLDFEIHAELHELINDLDNGKAINAVRRLAKVVENKLKERADADVSFKGRPMLHNLLTFAQKKKWITDRQFENALVLKEMRNKESHELDVLENSRNIGMCIYSGIDILYTL